MKRAVCMILTLVLMLSAISCPVWAATISVTCHPGETIKVIFTLSEDGEQPDGVMGRLQFDTDVFTVIPSRDLIGTDGINILNREPVTISFRVSKYAPAGQYSIEVKVIEAYDADGKKYTNVRINPVQVTVESMAAATPENQPELTPTGRSLQLPSAESTGKNQIKAGDYVTFGRYPQKARGNDQTPIEWLVLDYDEKNNKVLLLSRYGLDEQPYNTIYKKELTWENSTLRAWLNKDFMNKAFTAEERAFILTTNVDNSQSQGYSGWDTSGGNNTQDKIFLLSYAEAHQYLAVEISSYDSRGNAINTSNVTSRVSPTAYANRNGTNYSFTNDEYQTAEGDLACPWRLRSPGKEQGLIAYVHNDGAVAFTDPTYDDVFIRPALWVSLDSGIVGS